MKRELPPIEWMNKKVKVYRNLRDDCMSVKYRDEKVRHAMSVLLEDVVFTVNEDLRQKAIADNQRNVHAYAVGVLRLATAVNWSHEVTDPRMVNVSYNPFKLGYFYNRSDRSPIYTAAIAAISYAGVTAQLVGD